MNTEHIAKEFSDAFVNNVFSVGMPMAFEFNQTVLTGTVKEIKGKSSNELICASFIVRNGLSKNFVFVPR